MNFFDYCKIMRAVNGKTAEKIIVLKYKTAAEALDVETQMNRIEDEKGPYPVRILIVAGDVEVNTI